MHIVELKLYNFSTSAGELMTNTRHIFTVTFDTSHIGQVTGTVNCSNFASWRTVNIDFNVVQPMVGFNISMSSFSATIGQGVVFVITAEEGSAASVTINFGDGSTTTVPFPQLLAKDENITLTHQFYADSNYTISATVSNSISSNSFTFQDKLIVQKVVTNISLQVPNIGNISDGLMVFQLVLDSGAPTPGEICFSWKE